MAYVELHTNATGWKRGAKIPKVLVQLPMFNETHVAARIIDYACRMDYPRDKFEVQALDDSTDQVSRARARACSHSDVFTHVEHP